MPDMDGITLMCRIQTIQPSTPTLLMTAHGELDLAVEALKMGAYYLIQKPINRELFMA